MSSDQQRHPIDVDGGRSNLANLTQLALACQTLDAHFERCDDSIGIGSIENAQRREASAEPQVHDKNPTRGLLRLTLSAILYATSAGVTLEGLSIKPRARSSSARHHPAESDSNLFPPGKIDIRHVRQLQEMQRAPDGGPVLARFMVRGHWRRPAKS